jgi:YgiT-type zinc finger domain-containing protein
MKCVVCKTEGLVSGTTTVTLERGELTLVIRDVPAAVCPNCGEAYVDEATTSELLRQAETVAAAGTLVDVRSYAPLAEAA